MKLEILLESLRDRPYIYYFKYRGETFFDFLRGFMYYATSKADIITYKGLDFKNFEDFLSKKYSDESNISFFELIEKYEEYEDERLKFIELLNEYGVYLENRECQYGL